MIAVVEQKAEHPGSKEKAMNDRSSLSLSKGGVEDVANVRGFSVRGPRESTTTAGRTAVISKERLERSKRYGKAAEGRKDAKRTSSRHWYLHDDAFPLLHTSAPASLEALSKRGVENFLDALSSLRTALFVACADVFGHCCPLLGGDRRLSLR